MYNNVILAKLPLRSLFVSSYLEDFVLIILLVCVLPGILGKEKKKT
jgi:hypothetical protein